ncbi:MAG: type II toxin-antitoxin system VapC family toxin [Akkermansiaceae bacterium]|jgi:predicted nucleic acid-binding protein|nr:PIN domain-containing protein [Luteolibacter sp.]
MTHRYGIDTSIFIRLLTGDPQTDYEKTVKRFEARLEKEPQAEFFVSNQVIGEAYIALQHHYKITKTEAKSAIISVLSSGLCSPVNGASVMEALHANHGCGLIDRLIADDYAKDGIALLTNDQKMSRLPSAQKL